MSVDPNVSMNQSTVAYTQDMRFPVGISYITIGVTFILLHAICAYLMHSDKEMKNPTYDFMVHLSIIDCVCLSCIGIYAGSVLVSGVQYGPLDAVVPYLQVVTWFVSCVVLDCVAFSRWISITRPHLLAEIFR